MPIDRNYNKTQKTIEKSYDIKITQPIYSFEDMVLEDKTRKSIMEAISITKYKDKLFNEWNLANVIKKPTNISINFYGESGTGKTMAANSIAHYLNIGIIQVNYADIESKYVGETSKNLSTLFKEAENKNALIIFDEADALLSKRVTDMSSSCDVSINQTRCVLLTLLDNFNGLVVFTTNFISNFDNAFMRRITHHIKFELPNEVMRKRILQHYLTNTVPNTIDIGKISKIYEGLNCHDFANALIISSLKTLEENKSILSHNDFENVIIDILQTKLDNKSIFYNEIAVEKRKVSTEYAINQINKI